MLAQLQKLDSQLDTARQRASELEQQRADRAALDQAARDAQSAHDALEQSRAQLRDRELQLSSLQTRIADVEQKLYGGRIRNPKELESFEKEANMFKQQRAKLEESVFALMERVEQSEQSAQAAAQKLTDMESARAADESAWQRELAALRAQIESTSTQIRAARAALDDEQLDVYDRLRKRSAVAVALVRGNLCGACGIQLTSDVQQRAQDESAALAQCDNCRRILYVE